MENYQNDYHFSFFKPGSLRAKKNRNLTLLLVSIWAVGIFGFQILLKVTGKPTPEPAHVEFHQVWNQVQDGEAEILELRTFSKSVLQVLAKVYIKPEYKSALENAFSWSVFQLAGEDPGFLLEKLNSFEQASALGISILDPAYLASKTGLEAGVADLLGLDAKDARRMAIPFSLKSNLIDQLSLENQSVVEKAMNLYLVHNRSVITDTKFLGFPFHYFYTAVFLLCLFISLCWIYCVRTDKIEKEFFLSNPVKS